MRAQWKPLGRRLTSRPDLPVARGELGGEGLGVHLGRLENRTHVGIALQDSEDHVLGGKHVMSEADRLSACALEDAGRTLAQGWSGVH